MRTSILVPSFFLLATACTSSGTSSSAVSDAHSAPAAPARVPAMHQALDGKTFDVTLVEPERSAPDQLVFDAATFESSACRPYGFKPASYTATVHGDDVQFESTAKTKEGGSNVWKGTVHGSIVKGTLTYSGPKGESSAATFEGKLANGALDGRTYVVQMVGADGKPQEKDDLTFAAGSFDSSSCRPFGFIKTAYTTTKDGDAIRFQAVAASTDYPMNHWEGTIRGDAIEGTLKSGDAADAPTLRFSGKRKS